MKYDYLAGLTDEEITILAPKQGDDELLIDQKRRLGEIFKEQRRLEQEKKSICLSMSDPESAQRLISLTTKAARSIMQSEITSDNIHQEPYKEFDQAEQDFFQEKKHKQIYNLHTKVSTDSVVQEGIVVLKETGGLDLRSQRHKKKPSSYLGDLAKSKRIADLEKKQKTTEERLARLELSQKENEVKFDQIGDALLNFESKFSALEILGIDSKKIEAYRLSLEQPELTRQQIANLLGKSKPTIIKWLKEIKEEMVK